MLSSTRSQRSQASTTPSGTESSLKYTAAPGSLPASSGGRRADGDVRRHDHVRGAEQAALANQAARAVAHRELVVDGAGVRAASRQPISLCDSQ